MPKTPLHLLTSLPLLLHLILLPYKRPRYTSSTDAHISYSKPPGYSLHSFPRITPSSKPSEISGGGSAFLIREPAIVLNSSCHTFKSFECSSKTLQLASDILTVFNIYSPPTWSNYSQKPSVFLDEFGSLLSHNAATRVCARWRFQRSCRHSFRYTFLFIP